MKYVDVVANRRACLYPNVKAIEISRPTYHFSLWRMNSVSSVSEAFISLNVYMYYFINYNDLVTWTLRKISISRLFFLFFFFLINNLKGKVWLRKIAGNKHNFFKLLKRAMGLSLFFFFLFFFFFFFFHCEFLPSASVSVNCIANP